MKTKTIKELSALEIELLKETYKQGTRIECLYLELFKMKKSSEK